MADIVSEDTAGKSFFDIQGISPWIIKRLHKLRITSPTPIQFHCIPEILKGRDAIGAAKTGSGKTLAFILPVIQNLSSNGQKMYCLILTPTRELAFQISEQLLEIGEPLNLLVSVITGGLSIVTQKIQLSKNPHIIVATPGRMANILEYSADICLDLIKFLIFDEGDRLLDGRFDEDLQTIMGYLPKKRQTLLFSATLTDEINNMKTLAKSDVFVWYSTAEQATVEQLEEKYCLVNSITKDTTLVTLLLKFREEEPKSLAIVFTDTCKNAQLLSMVLGDKEVGIKCVCMHSMMKQITRLDSLAKFKAGKVNILIATDLASRGLDIPMVAMVINHCIPETPKTYIHRVGRTARCGKAGTAITLVTQMDLTALLTIEYGTKRKMTAKEADEKEIRKLLRKISCLKTKKKLLLDQTDFDKSKIINKRKKLIMEGRDPDEIISNKRKHK